MTHTFNIHEAKTKLSKLVELTLAGEEVVIAKDGVPVAQLVIAAKSRRPQLGEFEPIEPTMPENFDLDNHADEFEDAMLRKDRLLIELMQELANEQSAA